jgi:hypothetical protein
MLLERKRHNPRALIRNYFITIGRLWRIVMTLFQTFSHNLHLFFCQSITIRPFVNPNTTCTWIITCYKEVARIPLDIIQHLIHHVCMSEWNVVLYITVRDYRRGNKKWTIQKNRQHNMVHKRSKTRHKHNNIIYNICWCILLNGVFVCV